MYKTKTHRNTFRTIGVVFCVENYGEWLQRCVSKSETPNTVSLIKTDVNNLPNFF